MVVATTLGGWDTSPKLKEAVDLRFCNTSKDIFILASVSDWMRWTFVERMRSFLVINDLVVVVVEVGKSDLGGGLGGRELR